MHFKARQHYFPGYFTSIARSKPYYFKSNFFLKIFFYLLHVFLTSKFSGWHLNHFVLELRGWSRGRVQGWTSPPPDMTRGFLIQLVFTSGHQSVTPFLSGAPLLKKSWIRPWNWFSVKMIATRYNYRSQGTQGSLKIILFYNIYSYSWIYPVNTTEWHNFSGQDEAIGNKTSCWAGLDISLPRREKW